MVAAPGDQRGQRSLFFIDRAGCLHERFAAAALQLRGRPAYRPFFPLRRITAGASSRHNDPYRQYKPDCCSSNRLHCALLCLFCSPITKRGYRTQKTIPASALFTCVFDVRVLLHNFSGVLYIDLLHGGNASETGDLRVDLLKCAACHKLTHPGVLVFARHIVVGVIACHDHERP